MEGRGSLQDVEEFRMQPQNRKSGGEGGHGDVQQAPDNGASTMPGGQLLQGGQDMHGDDVDMDEEDDDDELEQPRDEVQDDGNDDDDDDDDDVSAVGADILGVGPTMGLVADDPTSVLGPLPHYMTAALLSSSTTHHRGLSGTSGLSSSPAAAAAAGSCGHHAVHKDDFAMGSIAEAAYTDAGLGLGPRGEATTEEPKYLLEPVGAGISAEAAAGCGVAFGGSDTGEEGGSDAAAAEDEAAVDGEGGGGLAEGAVLYSEANTAPVVVDAVVPVGAGTVGVPSSSRDQRHLDSMFGPQGT